MLYSPPKNVTLRDVAALAGIDKATASRALNGKGQVSEKTREAVRKAALELGFQPDAHAQRLAHGRSHKTIGLFPRHDLGVLEQQSTFIEFRLDEMAYEVEIHRVPRWVNHFEERQVALFNKVRRERPRAIIASFPLFVGVLEELRLFMEEGGIVVSYGARMDLECDHVHFDDGHRVYLAARYLLELGHRKLGFCSHGGITQGSPEIAGFSRAMEEFGAPIERDWLFAGGNYEEGGARLAEAFLNWSEKPTGLCIVNDVSASAFVNVLSQNGLHVPEAVSVVGFDDANAARYAQVPLTSAKYPLEAIGLQVVEMAQSRLQGYDGPPRTVTVQSEIVVRKSTAPYKQQSQRQQLQRLTTCSA